ncbi:uncharacterized protein EAE98_007431 [Botrytis deweyae]|uniref:Major facilitator superfamily (MFS) profile domain-containing protein n=1 Tax=Botrytis deweyae TaxID=2478750 RepID=A0ABQ7IHL0_9HELO|nr:uncharacterized protein EAE98_007431 [Botrytis deweyae]KAF7924380.1 hypothetical protein EAE98_007431 [Botrytis deweyae]
MLDLKPEADNVEYSERGTIEQHHRRHHQAVVVQGNEDEPGSVYQLSWKTIIAFISLSMANSCAALANTANTVIKFQVASVAKSPADAALSSWIANGSFLVVLALGPIFGSLSDRVGKKWFMVCGAILGLIGSVIAGKAEKILQIIGGNILCGAANAGCEIIPNRLRPWAMGASQAMASAFVVLGTFLAAAFVKVNAGGAGGWRWAYYFNGIIYGITAAMIAFSYFPPLPRLGRHKMLSSITKEIDYIGILLMSGSFASLIIGLTWGGTTHPWNSGQCIGTLTAGCIGLLIFGLYEAFVVTEGIFDHRLFETINFPILLFVCTIDGMLLLGVNVLYSQEIYDLFTADAVRIAVILSPFLVTSAFGCIPAGWVMASTKAYRWMLVGSLFWCALFTGLMAMVTSTRLPMAFAFTTLFGLGTAVTTTIPTVALGLSVPAFLIGTAATVSSSCRALGGVIGITMFTAIYNNKYAELVGPEIAANTNAPVLIDESVEAWKYVWIAVASLLAASGVAACFLKSVAPMMNHHVESALEPSKLREAQLS